MRFIFFTTFKKIGRARRMSQFLVLISFLMTFVVSRIVTHLQRTGIFPIQAHEPYIHHLVPGIFLILISGYVGISFWSNTKLRWFMAVLFGMGAALTIDEFALWLYLRDVYWAKQGRDSIDAIIILATIFAIIFAISEFREHHVMKKIEKIEKDFKNK